MEIEMRVMRGKKDEENVIQIDTILLSFRQPKDKSAIEESKLCILYMFMFYGRHLKVCEGGSERKRTRDRLRAF